MAEVDTMQTPETAPQAAPPAPIPNKGKKKDSNKKKYIKNLIVLGVVAAALAVGGFALHKFLNSSTDDSELFSQPAALGTIQSKVSGNGNSRYENSKDITLPPDTTIQVQNVLVQIGDVVSEGQPLCTYTAYSPAAQEKADAARKNLESKQKQMSELQKSKNDLTVRAPFSGKLKESKEFYVGDMVSRDAPVTTLVNDRQLKLSLYFSYAYEKQIKVGQKVNVSIPAVMGTFSGKVDQINKVSFISPEGGVHFEVVVVFDNPGTLTEGMDATATLTAGDGTPIYPYQNGTTEFYEQRPVVVKADGPVVSVGNLHDYANVSKGDVLLTVGADSINDQIEALNEEIKAAKQLLDEALKSLGTFEVKAPIAGSVMACNLEAGAEIKTGSTGQTAIMIADNSKMTVDIQVDDRNISFVKPGNAVELKDWNGNVFMGEITKIDMSAAQQGQGVTNYPVTLTVDNSDGSLAGGMWLTYSFVTKESVDCVTVPASSVQYFSDKDGNRQSVVFVRRDEKPEDTPELEMPTFEPGQPRTFPPEEEGFYPALVQVGLSDIENVEILSGVQEGDDVFVAYTVTEGSGSM